MNKFNFNKLTPFKWFVLENFPFIEADFDALTEWQLFCKLGKEMNKIINSENVLGTQMENVTNAFNDLYNYVNNYFDNLDIQAEIDKKLNEMVEDGTLQTIMNQYITNCPASFNTVAELKASTFVINNSKAITLGYNTINDNGGATYQITDTMPATPYGVVTLDNGLYAVLINDKPNVKMFGAIDSTTIDQTDKIKEAINYAITNKCETLELTGNYFVNQTISFDNISNLKIINGTIYVHETDTLLNTNFNVFTFNSCSNITLDNIRVIETEPVARTRKLKVGGFYFTSCKNCTITNCYLENTMSGIMLDAGTSNTIIKNNIINVTYQSAQFAQSAILNYASPHNIIAHNKIYGEYYDGTLSIFGSGTNYVIVEGNEIQNIIAGQTPIYISQGITIDQGPKETLVINNIICDQFYGIDNKADTYNTKIEGNLLKGCKISIADRQGEASTVNHTFGISIKNNKIIIQRDWNTANLATYLHYGLYYYVGILSQQRYSSLVKENSIIVSSTGAIGNLDKPVLGIDIKGASPVASNQYQQVFDVSGNNIEFSTGILATATNAPSQSTGIVVNDVKKGNFIDNTFKVDTIGNIYQMYMFMGANVQINIQSNLCYMTSINNHSFFAMLDDTVTVTQSNIINNKYRECKTQNLNDISNIVEYYHGNPVRRTKTIEVTTDWTDAFRIYSQYSNPVLIALETLVNFGGIKRLKSMYQVNINGVNVSTQEIYNFNNGLEIQFVNTGTTGYATCQVRSTTNFNSVIDVTEFRPYNQNQQNISNVPA